MSKFIPCLWYDTQAEEAANFYISIFGSSRIKHIARFDKTVAAAAGMSENTVMTVNFELEGKEFLGLNGGPHFQFSPATSFFINCKTADEVERFWEKLYEGGKELMPLDKYPFSDRYGWCQDKYGLSWQPILSDNPQKIVQCYMFVGKQFGKAEEAMQLYTSLFSNSEIKTLIKYEAGDPQPEGSVGYAEFRLYDEVFAAMESGLEHQFTFTPAVSLITNCDDQAEIDKLWNILTANGGAEEQCGWLRDRFGVSWQIVPAELSKMMTDPDPTKAQRVMEAVLPMKKLDLTVMRKAYAGK